MNWPHKGCPPKAIAQKLFVSASAVYKHLAHIRETLGVKNSFEMLRLLHPQENGGMPELRLSPRGKEVFAFMLQGMGNAEIAERLGMSVSGVKRHREKMLLQNNCKSIMELIAKHHGTRGESPEGAHPQE